ncbi:MAG: hypothetical protein HY426_04940 [Candidatus Levybacteria bacterium]|nr:hypothetical protein [Candidatus Levybacteria bacterium]
MRFSGKQIVIAIIVIQLVALPIILLAANNQQETRSRAAEKSVQSEQLPESGMAAAQQVLEEDGASSFQPETQTQAQATATLRASGIANNPAVKREVYAFIWYPYVDSDSDNAGAYLQYPYMTTLAYAGLSLGKDGEINKNDSSYKVWKSQRFKKIMTDAKAAGVKIHPRIATFDSDRVNYLLATAPRRQKAIANIISEIKNAPVAVDGVNIDFEPVPTQSRDEFTDFIKNLRSEMDKINPDLEIVIDTFASTAKSEAGFDLRQLAKYTDGFFIMSFTLVNKDSADKAGSLNPYNNLNNIADEYLAKVPADKIILGYPFYTGRWGTKDNSFRSKNMGGGGGLILYKDAHAEAKAYGKQYNDAQKTAWYSYYTCGAKPGWKQVYFDDENALSGKFQIANAKNLRGVGFWTFNQDKSIDTWKAIYNSFADKNLIGAPAQKAGANPERFSPNAGCKAPGGATNPPASPTPSPRVTLTPTPTPTPHPSPTPKPSSMPTPTPTLRPGQTALNFSGIKLHGIGKGGDSTNPNGGGTKNPLRTKRTLTVEIYNTAGVLVTNFQGNINFQAASGDFSGIIPVPDSLINGNYIIKIKTPQYLKRQLRGIMSLIKGQSNSAAPPTLIAGDVNEDNTLSNLDYQIIIDCYSDLLPAKSCDSVKKAAADLSDDGRVNQDDYSLFLRELSVQQGE